MSLMNELRELRKENAELRKKLEAVEKAQLEAAPVAPSG
jgi:hypothetical protein